MSKLTLDLNGLNVESFSPEDPMGSPRISDVMTCIPNAVTPMSLTNPRLLHGRGGVYRQGALLRRRDALTLTSVRGPSVGPRTRSFSLTNHPDWKIDR
jgi:hypothetical protein